MSDIKSGALNAHNKYRKDHGAPPLKWSSKLQNSAQKWANQLARAQQLQHDNQQAEGENLAFASGKELTGESATADWYSEIKDYKFNKPGFSSQTGHFTQVVWVGSEELGVAKAVSPNGKQYIVARYYPPGNNMRTFAENVFPKGTKMQSRPDGAKSPTGSGGNNSSNPTSPKKQSPAKTNNKPSSNAPGITVTQKPAPAVDAGRQTEKAFQNSFLKSHNMYRKRHGSAPLKWNAKLAKVAADAAEEASNTNTLRAIDMENVGQNMMARSNGELPGDEVAKVWYSEESKFNYNSPGFSSATGKFTQMVWKDTKEVGVGRSINNHGQTFVVALYQPPGNVRGKYPENVASPKGPVPTESEGSGCKCTIL